MKNKIINRLIIFIILFELIIYLLTPFISSYSNYFISILLILVLIKFYLYKKKDYKSYIFLIMVIGILIRTLYILNVSINNINHDLGNLNNDGSLTNYGHLAYIYTIYSTGKLPLVNTFQMYHPPLWHLIGALWIKVNTIFDVSIMDAFEGLQVISCIFSSLLMIIIYKIIEKIKMKDNYKVLTCLLMFSYPTYTYLAGSINNDLLLYFFEYLIILYALKWYENDSWKNTILLALSTGLCVMTKFNGVIMAIPLMYFFIKKLIKNIKKKNNLVLLIKKYLLFGLISLPIGLWFQVRNFLLFGNNDMSLPIKLYTGNHSIISRFVLFSFKEFFEFIPLPHDYNLPSFMIKSMIVDEFWFDKPYAIFIILVVLNLLFVVVSLIATYKYLKNNKKDNNINFLLVLLLTNIVSEIIFYFQYPYSCSMCFRYVMTIVFSLAVLLFNYLSIVKNKRVYNIVLNVLLFFSILSFYLPYILK